MSTIHFLNAYEDNCDIIPCDSGKVAVIDISNANNDEEAPAKAAVKLKEVRHNSIFTDKALTMYHVYGKGAIYIT